MLIHTERAPDTSRAVTSPVYHFAITPSSLALPPILIQKFMSLLPALSTKMFLPRSLSEGPSTMSPESNSTMSSSTISMAPCAISREQSPEGPKSNIRVVTDLQQLKDILERFPEEEISDHDLLLNCPEKLVRYPSVAKIVNELRSHRRLVSFDPDREILKVQAMPHNLHDAIKTFMDQVKADQFLTAIPSAAERRRFLLADLELRLGKCVPRLGNKHRGWKKHPDTALFYRSPESKHDICRIVFETGLTESYDDLASDARQWLTSTHGQVQLVVIVKITEDLTALKRHKKQAMFQRELRRLVTKYGNELLAARHGIELDRVVIDDEFPLSEFEKEIKTSDWFGSITVFMEFWELYDGRPRLRPDSYVRVIPVDPNAEDPRITIQDLIPLEHRGEHDLAQDKALVLPLDLYRTELERMRSESAITRAFDTVWPCKERETDPDYIPSDGEV